MLFSALLPLRWVLALAIAVIGAACRDFTVDDNDPAISYSPSNQWSQGSQCSGCRIHPDPAQTFEGTWHDSTYDPSVDTDLRTITFSFTGISVKVFNILPPIVPGAPTSNVDLTFELDGSPLDTFTYTPSEDSQFAYNQVVFSSGILANDSHTLVVRTTSGVTSVVLFDYIVYTVPDPPLSSAGPPSIKTTTQGAISSSSTSSMTSDIHTTLSSGPAPSPTSPASSDALSPSDAQSASPLLSSASSGPHSGHSSQSTQFQASSVDASTMGGGSVFPGILRTTTATSTSFTVVLPQSTSTGRVVPAGAVIGGAAGGGIILLILLAALVYLLCIRRARRRGSSLKTLAAENQDTGDDSDARFPDLRRDQSLSDTREHLLDDGGNPFVDPSSTRRASLGFRTAHSSRSTGEVLVISDPMATSPISDRSSGLRSVAATADSIVPCPPSSHRPRTSVRQPLSEEKTDAPPVGSSAKSPSAVPFTSAPTTETPPAPADTRLFEQLSALQQEIARLRVRQEAGVLLADAPPRYVEA
ncbi:hypothetical protein OH77DRAFT_483637 [Trametes cingulata]|nr:hypothetical protein OH77DRAFT_483637 [Trametes cingulata]